MENLTVFGYVAMASTSGQCRRSKTGLWAEHNVSLYFLACPSGWCDIGKADCTDRLEPDAA